MAHEMGHVKNYDIRVSLIVFGLVIAIGLIADIIFRMIFWGGRSRNSNLGGPAFLVVIAIGLVAAILAPIVAAVVQAAVSRQREYLADATSVADDAQPRGARERAREARTSTAGRCARTNTRCRTCGSPTRTGPASWRGCSARTRRSPTASRACATTRRSSSAARGRVPAGRPVYRDQ